MSYDLVVSVSDVCRKRRPNFREADMTLFPDTSETKLATVLHDKSGHAGKDANGNARRKEERERENRASENSLQTQL